MAERSNDPIGLGMRTIPFPLSTRELIDQGYPLEAALIHPANQETQIPSRIYTQDELMTLGMSAVIAEVHPARDVNVDTRVANALARSYQRSNGKPTEDDKVRATEIVEDARRIQQLRRRQQA